MFWPIAISGIPCLNGSERSYLNCLLALIDITGSNRRSQKADLNRRIADLAGCDFTLFAGRLGWV
jgi:hypothetical protein